MDWQQIRTVICEGRNFTLHAGGCHVLADTIMPSGATIVVHFQPRTDHLMVHDGGAAFDELTRHGVEIKNLIGVRRMLSATGFNISDEGVIWRDHVEPRCAAEALAIVADASLRAANYMLAKGYVRSGVRLDQRVRDALRSRFPQGHANFTFAGKHRQHTFDFGFVDQGRTVLLQAVSPDQASIASAIVKGLDAQGAEDQKVIPIFVFDPDDDWKSDSLALLSMGGRQVEFSAASQGRLPLAA